MGFKREFTSAPWGKKGGLLSSVEGGRPYLPDGYGGYRREGRRCLEIIQKMLSEMDAKLSSVVRTRMFVTDISKLENFGKAHAEFFGDYPPTTTMVEVKQLVDPQMLIEIEADAFVGEC